MRVRKTRRFLRELDAATAWHVRNRSESYAGRFYLATMAAAKSLVGDPTAGMICRESDDLPGGEYREIHFGVGRKKSHRLVFRDAAPDVEVVAVRGFGQRDLTPGDI